jgi:hypothetical protein
MIIISMAKESKAKKARRITEFFFILSGGIFFSIFLFFARGSLMMTYWVPG